MNLGKKWYCYTESRKEPKGGYYDFENGLYAIMLSKVNGAKWYSFHLDLGQNSFSIVFRRRDD